MVKCRNQSLSRTLKNSNVGVTLVKLLRIIFDSYSANTQHINVTNLK